MADDGRDMLMILEMAPRQYVPAECSSIVAADDPLASGFQSTGTNGAMIQGNYFAIEDFTFQVSLQDKDDRKNAMDLQKEESASQVSDVRKQVSKTIGAMNDRHLSLARWVADRHSALERRVAELEAMVAGLQSSTGARGGRGGGIGGGGGGGAGGGGIGGSNGGLAGSLPDIKDPSGKDSTKFARFMNEGRGFALKSGGKFQSDLDEVSITKQMDVSSTTLFDSCTKSFKFTSATILKRKAIGDAVLRGYLRIEFYDVMLTELNWDDDETVKEKFKFVCRRAKVQYSVETSGDQSSKSGISLKKQPAMEWGVLDNKS